MLRAFGGSVIAHSDSTAGKLATHFGLASDTRWEDDQARQHAGVDHMMLACNTCVLY